MKKILILALLTIVALCLLASCGDKSTDLRFTLNEDGKSYSVTGIGTCTDTDIVIPAQYKGLPVTAIEAEAFARRFTFTKEWTQAAKIKSIIIPDSVTSIGDSAFYKCTGLTSIVVPDSVTSIGNSAFFGCSDLADITVDKNNTTYKSIDGSLYTKDEKTLVQYAIGKKNASFTIPDSVTSVGDRAFSGCTGLTSIVIPDSVTSIGSAAFRDCTGLTSIVIPGSVTSIGSAAFRDCTGLTSIVIPGSITSIGVGAFSGCTGLTSIVIPDSFASIDNSAFSGCTGLTNIVIPDSVTSIGWGAFDGCTGLTDVYYTGSEAEWAKISINSNGNSYITNAKIHYNYVPAN